MKKEKQDEAAEECRKFNVCDFCGGWWESTKGKNSAPVNYIYPFFLEEHTRCPRPADSQDMLMSVRVVRESDPGFKLPDPAKEWKPQQCRDYRPPVEPVAKVRKSVSEKDLIGWWI